MVDASAENARQSTIRKDTVEINEKERDGSQRVGIVIRSISDDE